MSAQSVNTINRNLLIKVLKLSYLLDSWTYLKSFPHRPILIIIPRHEDPGRKNVI